MPAKFYVATTLSNADQAKIVINRLHDFGHELTYNWTEHGYLAPGEESKKAAENEAQGVYDADLLFVIWPGGGGTHIEMGMAMALGKSIIFVAPETLEREVSFYKSDNVLRIPEINKAIEVAHKHLSKFEGIIQDDE
jgi:nucleoside 2-deoxyribosyltransferase